MACKCDNVVPVEETRDGETLLVCNQCREEIPGSDTVTKSAPKAKGKYKSDE